MPTETFLPSTSTALKTTSVVRGSRMNTGFSDAFITARSTVMTSPKRYFVFREASLNFVTESASTARSGRIFAISSPARFDPATCRRVCFARLAAPPNVVVRRQTAVIILCMVGPLSCLPSRALTRSHRRWHCLMRANLNSSVGPFQLAFQRRFRINRPCECRSMVLGATPARQKCSSPRRERQCEGLLDHYRAVLAQAVWVSIDHTPVEASVPADE